MTAILYRSNLSSSKYYHLVEKCLNSIPEICDDLRGEYGVMNDMPDLSYEHLMSAHAAGCVGMSFSVQFNVCYWILSSTRTDWNKKCY